jgi:hypothetical protein
VIGRDYNCSRRCGRDRDCRSRNRRSSHGTRNIPIVVVIMFSRHWKQDCFVWIDAFPPQVELPVDKSAIKFVDDRVLHDHSPISDARLTPR